MLGTGPASGLDGAEITLSLASVLERGGKLDARRTLAQSRIDALAIAIWNEMSVDEVLSLDLSYAPPFSPVWDPVLIAARKAFEAVEADGRA